MVFQSIYQCSGLIGGFDLSAMVLHFIPCFDKIITTKTAARCIINYISCVSIVRSIKWNCTTQIPYSCHLLDVYEALPQLWCPLLPKFLSDLASDSSIFIKGIQVLPNCSKVVYFTYEVAQLCTPIGEHFKTLPFKMVDSNCLSQKNQDCFQLSTSTQNVDMRQCWSSMHVKAKP